MSVVTASHIATGVMVYAKDVERLALFYRAVLQLELNPDESEPEHGYLVLEARGSQLIIHAIPAAYADEIKIQTPPVVREECALKFFFTVHDLKHAGDVAAELGGSVDQQVCGSARYWYCNALDPEGNVFQLRQSK